jgi:hypothetical protein
MPQDAQKKSMPFFSCITLKPAGAHSTRMIHQSSSSAEKWASPVLRHSGHLSISIQHSRAMRPMPREMESFQQEAGFRVGAIPECVTGMSNYDGQLFETGQTPLELCG